MGCIAPQPQGTSAIAQSHARSLGVVGMNPLGLPDNNTASRLASLPSQQHAVHQQQGKSSAFGGGSKVAGLLMPSFTLNSAQLGSDPMQFKDPSVNNYSSSNDLDNITENALASIDLRQSPNQVRSPGLCFSLPGLPRLFLVAASSRDLSKICFRLRILPAAADHGLTSSTTPLIGTTLQGAPRLCDMLEERISLAKFDDRCFAMQILITGSWEDLHENTALFVMFDSVEVFHL